jgi:hypothetical protein
MATLSSNTTADSYGGTTVYADGESFICITAATGQDKIDRFITLAEANRDEVTRIVLAAKAKRDWNFANPDKARDWPEFKALDRMKDKLCRAAGIKDS